MFDRYGGYRFTSSYQANKHARRTCARLAAHVQDDSLVPSPEPSSPIDDLDSYMREYPPPPPINAPSIFQPVHVPEPTYIAWWGWSRNGTRCSHCNWVAEHGMGRVLHRRGQTQFLHPIHDMDTWISHTTLLFHTAEDLTLSDILFQDDTIRPQLLPLTPYAQSICSCVSQCAIAPTVSELQALLQGPPAPTAL
jgi:hypothetical protein